MTDRDTALATYLSNRSVANRNALIAHHHGLIHTVIRKYLRIPLPLRDDAFQEGIVGLCQGIERYDALQGPFPTYVMWSIRAAIQKWMEANVRHDRCAPYRAKHKNGDRQIGRADMEQRVRFGVVAGEFGDDDSRTSTLSETLVDNSPGPQEYADLASIRAQVRRLMDRFQFTEREAAIIKEHVYEDVPLGELADRFGVSKQRMGQIKTALLGRMETILEQEKA